MKADIITTLPQTLIETILCLLPIDEAARTSILSKEWRYKWTTIPKLVVSNQYGEQIMETNKLFCAINQIMLLRQAPIQEFTLSIDDDSYFSKFGYYFYEIDQIILHLSRYHKVKNLALQFYEDYRDGTSYNLPLSIFSLHHLTVLNLTWCALDHQPTFSGFGSLISLSLDCVRVSIKTLLHLISNSPLKCCSLLMLAQNIIGPEKSTMIELLESLPVIEHLSILSDIIPWFVPDLVPRELLTPLIHLKYFRFERMTFHDGYGLTFLATLIKSSPNLEKIELSLDPCHYLCDEIQEDDVYEEYHSDVWLEHISDVWLDHLNELKIKWFTNLDVELEFVKFILSRSPNLKKVSIKTFFLKKDQELDVLKTLLHAPCASMVEIDVD